MKYPLVWAKVEPWPFWPAVVKSQRVSRSASLRVTFVDKNWSEEDVSASLVVPFDQSARGLRFLDSDLEWAVGKGLFLLESTQEQRRRFVTSFQFPSLSERKGTDNSSLCPRVLLSSSKPMKASSSISEYERIRNENIEERKQLLESLQFRPLPPTSTKSASQRRLSRKRRSEEHHPLERRKSLRLRKSLVDYRDEPNDIGIKSFQRSSEKVKSEIHALSHRPRDSLPPPLRLSPEEVTPEILSRVAVRIASKVHDPTLGSTCHQCRQKTLDTKTSCRSGFCIGRRGQFCGICLKNRYGELVKEALLDPNWKCPICLGICNCSVCRNRNGKGPTGPLTHISFIKGFKSVKHYLQSLS